MINLVDTQANWVFLENFRNAIRVFLKKKKLDAFITHYYEKSHMVCHLFSSSDGKSLYITPKIVLNQITSTSSVIACDCTTNTWLNSVMQGEVHSSPTDAPPSVSVKFVPQFHSGRAHLQPIYRANECSLSLGTCLTAQPSCLRKIG